MPIPEPWEDPKDRTPSSGLQYAYGVNHRALRWMHLSGSSQGSGMWLEGAFEDDAGSLSPMQTPETVAMPPVDGDFETS